VQAPERQRHEPAGDPPPLRFTRRAQTNADPAGDAGERAERYYLLASLATLTLIPALIRGHAWWLLALAGLVSFTVLFAAGAVADLDHMRAAGRAGRRRRENSPARRSKLRKVAVSRFARAHRGLTAFLVLIVTLALTVLVSPLFGIVLLFEIVCWAIVRAEGNRSFGRVERGDDLTRRRAEISKRRPRPAPSARYPRSPRP
jgi:hypothetical protein